MQIEDEFLPSTSNKLKQPSEIDDQHFIEEENSNNSTPINSRSSNIKIYLHILYIYIYIYLYYTYNNKIISKILRLRRTGTTNIF